MIYQPDDYIGGKYRIIETIGSGAMGIVYKAENVNMGKIVCIKVLNPDIANNEEYLKRFIREARAAATLDHSNICTINDFDIDHGESGNEHIPYIVMEFLSGETLRKKLDNSGAFSPLLAVRIIRQLLNALSCAHEHGIVHRDVKPDNIILLQRDGRDDFLKLIDFGIAHIDSPQGDLKTLTQAGQIYGTPQYISPEQAQGDPVDFHADQYACGIILYEMLTGQPPFVSTNYVELLIQQVNNPPAHLPKHIPQSFRLDAIIQKLLAKNPKDRYDNTADIIPLLDDILIQFSTTADDDNGLAALRMHAMTISGKASSLSGQFTKPGTISAEEVKEQTKPANRKPIAIVAALVAVILICSIVLFILKSNSVQPIADDSDSNADVPPAPEAPETPVEPDAPELPPAPAAYNEIAEGFKLSDDLVLSQDKSVVMSFESFSAKKYADSLKSLDEVRDKYWDHPNFLRLFIITRLGSTYKHIKKDDELLKHLNEEQAKDICNALGHLFEIEPNATKNDDVRYLTWALFNSQAYYKLIKQNIYQVNNSNAATAVAWLIILSPYDRYEFRLERLQEVYKFLPHSGVPEWLDKAAQAWSFAKENCKARKAALEELASLGGDEIYTYVFERLLDRDIHSRQECGSAKSKSDCNKCLNDWLVKTVNEHKAANTDADGNSK